MITQSTVNVTKASGETEFFSGAKLMQSLMNAGASEQIANNILQKIEQELFDGIHTKKIYRIAFALLKKERNVFALKYKLKKAIMEFGPTGYPFEKFIGQLFEKQGFGTEVGVVVKGHCLQHEMDVIATQHTTQYIIECKYSQEQSKNVAIQVPLYVHSRVNDIIDYRMKLPEYEHMNFITGIVTNTRFTTDSLQYGKCKQLHLIAWDYPAKGSLKELIERHKLYPITILNALSKKEKQILLNAGYITCTQLVATNAWETEIELNSKKTALVRKELEIVN